MEQKYTIKLSDNEADLVIDSLTQLMRLYWLRSQREESSTRTDDRPASRWRGELEVVEALRNRLVRDFKKQTGC